MGSLRSDAAEDEGAGRQKRGETEKETNRPTSEQEAGSRCVPLTRPQYFFQIQSNQHDPRDPRDNTI